jgi:hypothetical protein
VTLQRWRVTLQRWRVTLQRWRVALQRWRVALLQRLAVTLAHKASGNLAVGLAYFRSENE